MSLRLYPGIVLRPDETSSSDVLLGFVVYPVNFKSTYPFTPTTGMKDNKGTKVESTGPVFTVYRDRVIFGTLKGDV